MKFNIQSNYKQALKDLANLSGYTMSDLVREGFQKVLKKELPIPRKDMSKEVGMSFVITYEQEGQLKSLSKETGVSLEEMFRIVVMDILANAQTLIERGHGLATAQEALQRRQNDLLDREEDLMSRKESAASPERPPNQRKQNNHH